MCRLNKFDISAAKLIFLRGNMQPSYEKRSFT